MLSTLRNAYQYFSNMFIDHQIEHHEEQIRSYTQINIGDNYVPEINKNVVLCIPSLGSNIMCGFNVKQLENCDYDVLFNKIDSDDYFYSAQNVCIKPNNMNELSDFHNFKYVNYFIKIKNVKNTSLPHRYRINLSNEYAIAGSERPAYLRRPTQ